MYIHSEIAVQRQSRKSGLSDGQADVQSEQIFVKDGEVMNNSVLERLGLYLLGRCFC